MEYLWAPWRIQYIEGQKPEECILCSKPAEDSDVMNYVLYRGKLNFVILNAYPYNPGHVMVSPYRHVASIEEMTDAELHEHFEIVRRTTGVIRDLLRPEGFNIGMNLGRVGGAGIEDHVHTHVVPRWGGDTNFMPVVADTRVLPEGLAATYSKLAPGFR